MAGNFVSLDSSGVARNVGKPGVGFRLVPAADVAAPGTTRVGSFPVIVRMRTPSGGFIGEPIPVVNSDAIYECDEGEEFDALDVLGGESGDSWLLQTFARKSHGVIPSSGKTRRTCTVQAATAVPTIVPVGAVGFRVRPGTLNHNFAFTGTLQLARIWVRTRAGTWIDTLEDIDATAEPVALRVAYVAADRVYLRAAAGTMNVEVDATEEVG